MARKTVIRHLRGLQNVRTLATIILSALTLAVTLAPREARAQAHILDVHSALPDIDKRGTTAVAPTAAQQAIVSGMGAKVSWNEFGTPKTLSKDGQFLATGLRGETAVAAARAWIDANKALYRLSSIDSLELYGDSKMPYSNGHAVHFKQTFGGLTAAQGGLITVGITGTPEAGWKVAYVSSSLTGDTGLSGSARLSPQEAWVRAATDLGRLASLAGITAVAAEREWTTFRVEGFNDVQRVRLVAVPTPGNGVRPAFETLVLDNKGGELIGYKYMIDAETGAVLLRENLVHQLAQEVPSQQTTPFNGAYDVQGTVPNRTGTCGSHDFNVPAGQRTLVAAAHATVAANDIFIDIFYQGQMVAHQDTGTSPEGVTYAPADGVPAGTYTVKVCPYLGSLPGAGPAPHAQPYSYTGAFTYTTQNTNPPSLYPPKWKVFPASPLPPELSGYPWNVPDTDIRKLWCWESVVNGVAVPGCEDAVKNLASRTPWDYDPNLNAPTFTTRGNNAISSESWTGPLSPGAFGHMPASPSRDYTFQWTNDWYKSRCNPTNFVPGVSNDISAAVTNLFAMHNRMHDWAYNLGFTEENWNAQQSNFGNGGLGGDPILGQSQAGGMDGGYPAYLGRDNANMRTLPDGVPSITNMYLWQPIRGSFYAPCVDGDYDMSVIGHEYGHMIENRMIGKGANRSGHHAGAMGESNGDLNGVEILNEYGFVPVADENPFTMGAFATGDKRRGIRNYAMNQSPLNFSNMGYDPFFASGGTPVHADGEIWSATNFDIRQALVEKYNATHPASDAAMQRQCADGKKAPEDCPGNRRWVQIMYDAYLLMPTAPTMLQARDAYLAADMMRFGGANQDELWLAFARRGFGAGAATSNAHASSDTDPKPDFASPRHDNATVTFKAVAQDEGSTPVTGARIFVGHYEARVSPVADTNPQTNATGAGVNNLDDVAQFVPGTYEFVVHAPGYGHFRFTRRFTAGSSHQVTISMPTNLASTTKGATAAGGGNVAAMIDDTETTTWTAPGTPSAQQVTVDLAGTAPKTINRVQVSSMIQHGQNRFTALRQFRVDVSTDGTNFTPAYTSPADAFPGSSPRPGVPDMIVRSFSFPAVQATHARLVVLHTQCTGQTQFHGVQDNDPLNATDCRGEGEPAGTDPAGPSGQTGAAQNTNTRAAEFQVFESEGFAAAGDRVTDLNISTLVNGCVPELQGKVTLDGPAPAGGTVVTITENHPAAEFPTTVLVPEGHTSRSFKFTVSPVTTVTKGDVTATAGGGTITRTLTVRPIRVDTLTLNPNRVKGGNSSTGTVTLECGAAPGDITVALESSAPSVASVPASVVIPAGSQSATFTITTKPVNAAKTIGIKATAGGLTISSPLVVEP
ncbi:MAG TPA: M36 family metallopeptidase [Pyrinomonadaceae bacterium]|nr:M36 family metallopeptidase [Pyrinomonadaceae bacterium]